jgi:hypothetical protein
MDLMKGDEGNKRTVPEKKALHGRYFLGFEIHVQRNPWFDTLCLNASPAAPQLYLTLAPAISL